MNNKTYKKPLHPALVILCDILCVGLVLIIFALFHHVIPRKVEPISDTLQKPNPSSQPVVSTTDDSNPSSSGGAQGGSSVEAHHEPGDFSDKFPTYDTGKGALYSHQGDNFKVAINKYQENNVTYFVADVWVKNISAFRTAFAKGEFVKGYAELPVNMANDNNAVFAISGDYCGARASGVVIRNGVLYRDSVNSDVCVLFNDGTMETYSKNEFDLYKISNNNIWQAWAFGPELLDNGKALTDIKSSIWRKNPRSAIGYYEPGHYCFVTVDGRQPGYSDGMTLDELSALFASLGCKTAFNLDGGATAEMVFEGQVVNRPYDGGRRSSDIICF